MPRIGDELFLLSVAFRNGLHDSAGKNEYEHKHYGDADTADDNACQQKVIEAFKLNEAVDKQVHCFARVHGENAVTKIPVKTVCFAFREQFSGIGRRFFDGNGNNLIQVHANNLPVGRKRYGKISCRKRHFGRKILSGEISEFSVAFFQNIDNFIRVVHDFRVIDDIDCAENTKHDDKDRADGHDNKFFTYFPKHRRTPRYIRHCV